MHAIESVSFVSGVPQNNSRQSIPFMCSKTAVTEVQFQKTLDNRNKQKQDLLSLAFMYSHNEKCLRALVPVGFPRADRLLTQTEMSSQETVCSPLP